jgi:hypothetical protein
VLPRLKRQGKPPDWVLPTARGTELRAGRAEGRYHILVGGPFKLRS